MNIQTVAENLRNTIAGKEQYLTECNAVLYKGFLEGGTLIAVETTAKFLKINIAELKRILQDLEQCQDDEYMKKAIEQSWRDNPDRSGGQFTQDEIDNASAWR